MCSSMQLLSLPLLIRPPILIRTPSFWPHFTVSLRVRDSTQKFGGDTIQTIARDLRGPAQSGLNPPSTHSPQSLRACRPLWPDQLQPSIHTVLSVRPFTHLPWDHLLALFPLRPLSTALLCHPHSTSPLPRLNFLHVPFDKIRVLLIYFLFYLELDLH